LPRGTVWSGCARPMGYHPAPACKIRDRCGEARRVTPDAEADVWWQADNRARARDRRASLIYISWYINGYGHPWTPLAWT
jgi:hypothetical protein